VREVCTYAPQGIAERACQCAGVTVSSEVYRRRSPPVDMHDLAAEGLLPAVRAGAEGLDRPSRPENGQPSRDDGRGE
jgi:hypothetical protein